MRDIGSVGSLSWAVRGSLLRYVTVIARGSYDLGGNATVDEHGVFTFPLMSAVQDGADRRLSFEGSLHFLAHHGALDIRIINPEVIIGPNGGAIVARTDDTETVSPIVATDAAVPTRDAQELAWSAVSTRLLDTSVALFGNVYPAGTDMAPFEMRMALDS